MTEWRECRLSDVMEIIGGGTPKTSVPEYWNGKMPWLSVADFNNCNRYVYDAEKYITELGLKNSSTKILKKGQLIISARGTVGAIAQLGRDMAFNQSCYGLNANSSSINDFLFYLLKYCITELKQQSNGGVFDTIIRETFDNINISLPPLPEQKAIAEVLSSLDDKIDLLTRQNKTLEDLAQAYFRKWFIEDASDEWEEKKLGEIVAINYGKALPERKRISGRVPVYSSAGVTGWHNQYLVESSGIVIGRKGTIGTIYWVHEPFYCIDTAYYITPNDSKYDFAFIYYLLKTMDLDEMNEDSAVPGLNRNTIYSQVILLPSEDLINKFSSLANTILQRVQVNNAQIRTLSKLRDILLPKLISGEIRVKM